jgi:TonB-linked SusC/RagA family outer membrane protein
MVTGVSLFIGASNAWSRGAWMTPARESNPPGTYSGVFSDIILPNEHIHGKVTDNNGNPVAGVAVRIKGKEQGTYTDGNGDYGLDASQGDVLIFSSVGFETQQVTVGEESNIQVKLVSATTTMNEVVVTALGISRKETSLTYANQAISGSAVNDVKSDNLMNALNGKVAGVDISPSSSGVGGSVKVIMRGNKNAFGSNQPLYVIDGIPMSNGSNANGQPNGTYGGGADGGDGISNLNPNDIASITFLEGASAAALYGSQAANGVVLITTKKGRIGKAQIHYSSSFTVSSISYKPKFQTQYGETPNGNQSWGAKLATPASGNNLSTFYVNGQNYTNSVDLSAGTAQAQTYFSYANTKANGVMPTNSLMRNNFTFREDANFLNDKLHLEANINYVTQKIHNTPLQGLYLNPITGLYLFPVGIDINQYKDKYGVPVASRNGLPTMNWVANEDVQSNPWWLLYKDPNFSTRNRVIISVAAKYEFTDWLSLQLRGNTDRTADTYEADLSAGSNPVNVVGSNGSFTGNSQAFTQTYGDAILSFNIPMQSNLKINGVLGASITNQNTVGQSYGAGSGLAIPNVFILQNVLTSSSSPVSTLPANHNQIQSLFGNLNFSYKDWLFLDLTGRNDWSSNLAFTNNESYFYPSVGLSFILSDVVTLPKFIDFAKLRGSYAEVASPVPQYITNPINYLAAGGAVTFNTVEPNPALKPTNTKSKEAGVDLRFLEDRIHVGFTWYQNNTYNQFIQYTPAASTGFTVGYLNAGNIENKGIELTLSYDVIRDKALKWNTSINYSSNKNTIIELNPAAPDAPIWLTAPSPNAYGSALVKGGSWGDIYGVKFERDPKSGAIMLNSSDQPINNNTFVKVGNANPKWQMGWSNDFNYKSFDLSFLIDGKFGGQVLSMTQMMMDSYGVSLATGQARDKGSVPINGVDPNGNTVTSVNPQQWYSTIGGRSGIAEAYIYSATVVRLRQVSLGYDFPIRNGFIKSLRLSLIGNNLFYFYKKAPYDPELTMSTSNGMSGVDVFTQPTTRNVGAQLNVTF